MKYRLQIKSGTDMPDFDQTIEATSIGQATEYFYEMLEGQFNRDYIRARIVKENEN